MAGGFCSPPNNLICKSFLTEVDSNILTFPRCQIIPDLQSRVTNPYYNANANTTYFSYKVGIQGCDTTMSFFYILLCNTIPLNTVSVSARIGACNTEVDLEIFESPMAAPPGYKYLGIVIDGDIIGGSCGIFSIKLDGRYEFTNVLGDFIVTVNSRDFRVFDEWVVPSCLEGPILQVSKECEAFINEDKSFIDYRVTVTNAGDRGTDVINYNDIIAFPIGDVIIGDVVTNPSDIVVDTSVPGLIKLSYQIRPLNPLESFVLEYRVYINAFINPGEVVFRNIAIASSDDLQASDSCVQIIEVVELLPDLLCSISDNIGIFTYQIQSIGQSPQTTVGLTGTIGIPDNITIEFNEYSGCTPTFRDTGLPVPLGIPISDSVIDIYCQQQLSPSGILEFEIEFSIVSASFAGGSIDASFDTLGVIDQNQIYLAENILPLFRSISIENEMQCLNSCEGR